MSPLQTRLGIPTRVLIVCSLNFEYLKEDDRYRVPRAAAPSEPSVPPRPSLDEALVGASIPEPSLPVPLVPEASLPVPLVPEASLPVPLVPLDVAPAEPIPIQPAEPKKDPAPALKPLATPSRATGPTLPLPNESPSPRTSATSSPASPASHLTKHIIEDT